MDEIDFRREVRLAVDAAEAASDPERGVLMDRTDLQRVIGQLLVTLQKVERACTARTTTGAPWPNGSAATTSGARGPTHRHRRRSPEARQSHDSRCI